VAPQYTLYTGITGGGLCAICCHSERHVRLLRQRCLPHLRGISFPSAGYAVEVERLARHPKGSRAKTSSSSLHLWCVLDVHYRRPPASVARTAASRTSAVAQGRRTPDDRDLPRCCPRVQTRSRTGHQCSAQNGAV